MYARLVVSLMLQLLWRQQLSFGPCPKNITTIPDFNVTQYLGRWFEYARYPSIFEGDSTCTYDDYDVLPNGRILMQTYNTGILPGLQEMSMAAEANITAPGKLHVHLKDAPDYIKGFDYWILDTNYVNYSVVYSCAELPLVHAKFLWILTRGWKPSNETVEIAKSVLTRNNLSLNKLILANQKKCKFT